MDKKPQQQPASETAKKGEASTGSFSRLDAAALVVQQLTGTATLEEVNAAADALYVQRGGKSNLKKALSSTKWAVQAAEKFGFIVTERTVTIRAVANG